MGSAVGRPGPHCAQFDKLHQRKIKPRCPTVVKDDLKRGDSIEEEVDAGPADADEDGG